MYGLGLAVWAIGPTPEGRSLLATARSSRLTRPLVAAAGVLGAAGIAAFAGAGAGPAPLSVSVLDVGQGDAIFVRAPSGRTLLVDGGPNPTALAAQLGRRMGLVEHSLSATILTRADEERLPGMIAAAERYSPGLMLGPPEGSSSALFHRWESLGDGASHVGSDAGGVVQLDADVAVEYMPTVPLPAAAAAGSPQRTLLVRVVFGDTAVLIAPSLTAESARSMLRAGVPLRADALIVPRHGATNGLDAGVLAEIAPSVAVISAGAGNRQGLPTRETLDLLQRTSVFRTDLNGTIELQSDGKHIRVIPERGG
jgi:beta-lactamase superfamily II metal-dependent hydrolase